MHSGTLACSGMDWNLTIPLLLFHWCINHVLCICDKIQHLHTFCPLLLVIFKYFIIIDLGCIIYVCDDLIGVVCDLFQQLCLHLFFCCCDVYLNSCFELVLHIFCDVLLLYHTSVSVSMILCYCFQQDMLD